MLKRKKNDHDRGWPSLIVWLLIITFVLTIPFYEHSEKREFEVLAVNDIYRVLGVDGEQSGSLARLHTLRRQMCTGDEDVLLLHAGDFLFPSVMSRAFNGEHMVGAMNLLDDRPGEFDTRMFVVPGNHEFDKNGKEGFQIVVDRLDQSEFIWLSSNLGLINNSVLDPVANLDNSNGKEFTREKLQTQSIVKIHGVKVGLFGLTIDVNTAEQNGNSRDDAYANINDNYIEVAREMVAALRKQDVDVVLAITHLAYGR